MMKLALISQMNLNLSAVSKNDCDDERANIKYMKYLAACNFDSNSMFIIHLGHWLDQVSDSINIKCLRSSNRRKTITEKGKFPLGIGIDRYSLE
jgi:hypothetical protein